MILVTRDVNVIDGGTTYPYPSATYRLSDVGNNFDKLNEYDEALFDACVKRLSTQKGSVRGYPEDYGMDWAEIHAMPDTWARQALPERIRACLSVDDRVKNVAVEIRNVSEDSVSIHLTINGQQAGEVTI